MGEAIGDLNSRCPHCGTLIRHHRMQGPVYGERAVFRSPDGCEIDGSLTLLSAPPVSTEDGGGDE